MPTLREVAHKAGVATSTVSRALRNSPLIPEETRVRIKALAEQMGYRPDPLIAALVGRRWKRGASDIGTLAWINAFPVREHASLSFFHTEVYAGAQARTKALGYKLEEFWLREPGMTGTRLSQILMHRGIRGLCVGPLPQGRGHIHLKWEHFASATIGYSMIRPNLHRVTPHHFQGILEALRQLRHQKFRRIGIWMHRDENLKVNYNWMAGTLLFPKLYPRVKCILLTGSWDKREFARWIKTERLDCVLGSSEVVEVWRNDLKIDIPTATLSWNNRQDIPGLDQKPSEIGAAAIDMIVGQLRRNETGVPGSPRVLMIEGEWRL